jgi:hypothetical protein
MNISRFFIDRPIFAAVIAVFITLIGAFAQLSAAAPVAVSGDRAADDHRQRRLPGRLGRDPGRDRGGAASSRRSTASRTCSTCPRPRPRTGGGDHRHLQAGHRPRCRAGAGAEPRRPGRAAPARSGAPDRRDREQAGIRLPDDRGADVARQAARSNDYIGNYANSVLRDRLLRVEGVGGGAVFGGGNYSMRVWIDPAKAAARNLTGRRHRRRPARPERAGRGRRDRPAALRHQRRRLPAAGAGAGPPDQRSRAVLQHRHQDRRQRPRDPRARRRPRRTRRQDYGIRGFFDGKRGVGSPSSSSRAPTRSTADRVKAEIDAQADLPPGIEVKVAYNPTEFVAASVESVQHTLFEAVILVVIVVIVFLQTWRAAIIPIVAIPVALVGTFAVQLALGYLDQLAVAVRPGAGGRHRRR